MSQKPEVPNGTSPAGCCALYHDLPSRKPPWSYLFSGVTADYLVKVAFLIEDQSKFVFIELLKEFVPGDLFQAVVLGVGSIGKLNPDDPDAALAMGGLNHRRLAAMLFRSFADLFMIGRRLRHSALLRNDAIAVSTGVDAKGFGFWPSASYLQPVQAPKPSRATIIIRCWITFARLVM
jgi:hypothetical protein